jgi:hypothetical protein
MPDPIWLDTNTLIFALKGDAAINRQLSEYRRAGRQLLVAPKVRDEILNGNVLTEDPTVACWTKRPYPEKAALTATGMRKIGVELDLAGGQIPQPQRIAYYGIAEDLKGVNVEPSDRLVLSQVKASAQARGILKPEMITDENKKHAMSVHASRWEIRSVPTAKPAPGSVPGPPRVILADYPPDKNGPVSNKFKDNQALKKSGLLKAEERAQDAEKRAGQNANRQAGMAAAQVITEALLNGVKKHYTSALSDARKEFEAKYPDPRTLNSWKNLPRYKAAYAASLSKLTAPSKLRVAEAVMLAFTRESDIEKVKNYLDAQISKVQSAADGTVSSYSKVAQEYIDAMIAAYKDVLRGQELIDIAADIEKRGLPLKNTGDALEDTYKKAALYLSKFPFAEYAWMDVHLAASVFQEMGGRVLGFSSELKYRYESYAKTQKQLDDEITKISNELAKYEP